MMRSWRLIVIGAVGLFLLLIAILTVTAPLSKSLQPITAPSLTLLSAEGIPIARRGAVVGEPVSVDELPPRVVSPFLAIEDRRFYSHVGIDPQGLARALLSNLRSGEVVEGGSTITQQLAKLSFLSAEQTLWRKLQEAVLAFWLEARLSKEDILSRYLSSVYFGDNVYGLRAAAHHYFSREPEELSLQEAAMLAGLVKAPSTLAPTKNLEAAQERASVVIGAMIAAGMLSLEEAERLPQANLELGDADELPSGSYFADWVFPQAEAALRRAHSQHRIVTTLEDSLQRAAVDAVRGAGIGNAQVALLAMRRDGRVVAMIGGKSYRDSPFNRATQARRQPGSTFKLFAYMAALREGYTPDSEVLDAPLRVEDWSPQNYGGRYRGEITLREAFAASSNVAAVRLAEAVGRRDVLAAARELGLSGPLEDGPTTTLGTSAVPLIEMVAAYAAVAAGQYPVRPRGLPLRDEGGTTPMDPQVRTALLDLLRTAVDEGTGRAAKLPVQVFGKTGTSQDGRDAYFVGFAGDLVTGVWIGHDDNRPVAGSAGGGLPAQIWRRFMAQAVASNNVQSTPATSPAPSRELPSQPSDEQTFVVPEYDVDPGTLDGTAGSEQPNGAVPGLPLRIPALEGIDGIEIGDIAEIGQDPADPVEDSGVEPVPPSEVSPSETEGAPSLPQQVD